jgi:hypothetical protein
MSLVKLTSRNGDPIYVNPAQVLTVEPYPLYATPDGKSRVELIGAGAKICFALAGRISTDDLTTDTEPYWQVVTECPRTVAGLCLEPVGP